MNLFVRAIAMAVVIGVLTVPLALAGSGPARVVSSTASRIVIQVDVPPPVLAPSRHIEGSQTLEIPGFGGFSLAGEPGVPGRDILVALPPDGAFSIAYTVLEMDPIGQVRLEPVPFPLVLRNEEGVLSSSLEYRVDPTIYNQGGVAISVVAQPEGRLRHHRVLPLRVQPVSYDPNTGETSVARSIRIEITLAGGGGGVRLPVRETDTWERIYSRVLVNAAEARSWRYGTRPAFDDAQRTGRAASVTAGPLVKLAVRDTGMHKVKASAVISAGFPMGTQVDELHLFQRGYSDVALAGTIADVAFTVIEDPSGTAGVFDGADELVFYGQEVRVDTLRHDPVEKFSEDNVYWLGSSSGPQMAAKAVTAGTVSADTATASFPVALYNERDLWFSERTPPLDDTTGLPTREFNYYNDANAASLILPFTLGAIKPGTTFELRARFLGGFDIVNQRDIQVDILNANGTSSLANATVPISRVAMYASGTLSADLLAEGANTLRFRPIGRSELEAMLDWFTIDYEASYRARGSRLAFNTGALNGTQNLTITGLGRTDVLLFDVSNPLLPMKCTLTPAHFTDLGSGQYALSFETAITTQQRYIMVPLDQIHEIVGSDIIEDEPSNLIGNVAENGVDILVVSHKDYLGEMQRWVDYRRAQGYRVLMTDVVDVFDEFNGGVPNARAIREFVKHFFAKGNAAFLLLVGDSSEDAKRVHIESGKNFVPTESFAEHVTSSVFNEDEIVTSDKWYIMLGADVIYDNATFPGDFYPDLIAGRLPAGTVGELRIMLDKILAFERPSADDFWRRRMIRVADDAWSGAFTSCFQAPELDFETAEADAATTTERSMPGGYDIVRFFLSDRISHPQSGCVSSFSQQTLTRADATPLLLGELAQGATVVSFQAHMNRFQICHEYLFTSLATVGQDWLSLENTGRPFIAFGMGCHLSDFAVHKETIRTFRNGPNGDCLSELMMFLDNKGAVATYASTGFEYLRENKNYTGVITEVFYEDPPVGATLPTGNNQVRWILGELMATSEIENLLRYPLGSGLGARGQAKRYHILGDPVMRMDAGPPRFEVTVDGVPFESGDPLSPSSGDSVSVRAVITDEVAIEKLSLEIDGVDETDRMTVNALVDTNLDAARQYEVLFDAEVLPRNYAMFLRAHQAADTSSGDYHLVAEFVFQVLIDVSLSINGRPIVDGDLVPARGDYLFELDTPIVIDPSLIHVEVDGSGITNLALSNPTPGDSTVWHIEFSDTLSPGAHTVAMEPGAHLYNVTVGSSTGVRDLIVYPNPFSEETYFVYSNDRELSNGTIAIFTTSGKKVAQLEIPSSARGVGQNAVRWDGTTWDGGHIANGAYLFVMTIEQGGQTITERGKLVKVR